MERNELVSFLQKVNIFESITPYLLRKICDCANVIDFPKDTAIIQKGEEGDKLYILLSGKVNIPVRNDKGELQFTSELVSGQVFGEMALLTGRSRSSDVIAVTNCTCASLDKDIVEHLMRTFPDMAQVLTAILRERVNRTGAAQKVGKYVLLEELGRGSMAVVYEGLHPDLDRPLAIKMLHHELVYQPQFSERFRNEAKIVAHLRHPHIVEVFDLEEAYATFFIIMEKVKGIELQHVLETRGKLSIAETRQILRQLLEALDFAHEKGVIHRDIKPTNIMLDDTGNVKLMDFGIAYLPKNTSGPDEEDMLLGTPHYMSPEQHTCGQIDERTDIYALGLLAYHMLTGELPFEGSVKEIEAKKRKTPYLNIKKGPKDLPEDLIAFIKHATARKHEDRAPNCKALLNLLASQDAGYTLSQITAKTITFTYPKEQQHVVRALLEKYKKQADAISHITSHTNHPS